MGLGQKLIDSKDLVVESFSILKKDKSLWIPPILSIITIALVSFLLLIAAIAIFFFTRSQPLLYLFTAISVFIIYYIATFYNAALTWMILEVKKGKDTTLANGLKRAFGEFFDIFLFAITSAVIGTISSALRKRRGLGERVIAGTLDLAWDLIGHMILPAMILTDKTFWQSWLEIKEYKKSIPQILVGKFGLGLLFGFTVFASLALIVFGVLLLRTPFGIALLIIGAMVLFFAMFFQQIVKRIYFTLLYIKIKKL